MPSAFIYIGQDPVDGTSVHNFAVINLSFILVIFNWQRVLRTLQLSGENRK